MVSKEGHPRYAAFISYRHLMPDMRVARGLQFLLEHNMIRPSRKVPRHIRPVFLDTSELPTLEDLDAGILDALDHAECLFVICSPNLGKSKYCLEEIRYFKKIHGGSMDRIFTIIVDGTPEEAFPRELRFKTVRETGPDGAILEREVPVEPLFADVRSKHWLGSIWKLYRKEYLRLAAAYYRCSFDALYKRHRRFQRKLLIACVTVALLAGLSVDNYGRYLKANAAASRAEELLLSDNEMLAMALTSQVQSPLSHRQENALRSAVIQHDYKQNMPFSASFLTDYWYTKNAYSGENTVRYLSKSGNQLLTLDDNMLQITDAVTGAFYLEEARE